MATVLLEFWHSGDDQLTLVVDDRVGLAEEVLAEALNEALGYIDNIARATSVAVAYLLNAFGPESVQIYPRDMRDLLLLPKFRGVEPWWVDFRSRSVSTRVDRNIRSIEKMVRETL